MTKFEVVILEDNEDTNIFTDPTLVTIDNNRIEVEYEGRRENFPLDCTKEIKIRIDR